MASVVRPRPSAVSRSGGGGAGAVQVGDAHGQPDGSRPGDSGPRGLAFGLAAGRQAAGGAHHQPGAAAEHRERQQRAAAEPQRESRVGGGDDDQDGEHRAERQVGGEDPRAGPAGRQHGVTEQRRAGDLRRPAKRPDREAGRGQRAVDRSQDQRQRVDPGLGGQRQQVAEQCQARHRERCARGHADRDAGGAKQADLQAEHAGYQACGRAQAAQRGDGAGPAFEPRAHAGGHADAAHQQCAQADQDQKQAGLAHRLVQAGGGLGGVADAPAGVGERRAYFGSKRQVVGAGRRGHAPVVCHQRAGLDQAGGGQAGGGDHHARAQHAEAAGPVRLADQGGTQGEGGVAEAQGVAGVQAEALQDERVGDDAGLGGRGGDDAGLGGRGGDDAGLGVMGGNHAGLGGRGGNDAGLGGRGAGCR